MLATFHLLHFAVYASLFLRCHRTFLDLPLPELVELTAGEARHLLLRLGFPYHTDSILNLLVGLGNEGTGLLPGFMQDTVPLLLDIGKLTCIGLFQFLHLSVRDAYPVAFLFPVAPVAGNVAQLLFQIDVVAAGLSGSRIDYLRRQPYLAGYLHGERTSRLSHLQTEQRTDVLYIEHHRSVFHPFMAAGEILDIGVVGGDDTIGSRLHETFENRFGYRPAYHRLRTRTEFVDKDERPGTCPGQHMLHVEQMRRVGTQVVVDGLFVTDVDEYAVEYRKFGIFEYRHRKTALEHVLQQPHGLETYRLASGIRTRNDEHAASAVELQVEGYHLFPLARQRLPQQRMACRAQPQRSLF